MADPVRQQQTFVTVPDVVTQTVGTAIGTLNGDGLNLMIKEHDLSYRPPEEGDFGKVIVGQEPIASAQVPPGYYVNVILQNVPHR